jgi:hypothetical protein
MLPADVGGANWPGGSFDPETNRLYIHSHTAVFSLANVSQDLSMPGPSNTAGLLRGGQGAAGAPAGEREDEPVAGGRGARGGPEALEAGEAVAPLLARRPAFRLVARHLLEDAGQAVLLPAHRPALRLQARHLPEDAGQAVLPLRQVGRAEAVDCAAALRCRDYRSSSRRMTASQLTT